MIKTAMSILSLFVVLAIASDVSYVGIDQQQTTPTSFELPADFDYEATKGMAESHPFFAFWLTGNTICVRAVYLLYHQTARLLPQL